MHKGELEGIMKLSCVLIEEDNRRDFDNVFPNAIELTDSRVAVAAVDELFGVAIEDFLITLDGDGEILAANL